MIRFFDSVRVDRTHGWLYAACSLSYLGAMVSSNSALQFVNYPTQVSVGRSGNGAPFAGRELPLMAVGCRPWLSTEPLVLRSLCGGALLAFLQEVQCVGAGRVALVLRLHCRQVVGVQVGNVLFFLIGPRQIL